MIINHRLNQLPKTFAAVKQEFILDFISYYLSNGNTLILVQELLISWCVNCECIFSHTHTHTQIKHKI